MRTSRVLLYAALLLVLPGCDREGGAAAANTAAAAAADRLAPDTLYGTPPAHIVRVTPVEIDAPGLSPALDSTRIAAISDLQLGLWGDNAAVAEAAVRKAIESGPDAIVLLGDFIARGDDTVQLAQVLAPLRGRSVFAVLGDRDIRNDSSEAQVTRVLKASGVHVLRNSAAPLARGGGTLLIAGLDPHLLSKSSAEQEWVVRSLGGPQTLLLSHVPGLVPRVGKTPFVGALAGHTFCGDVEIAGTPRLSWLNSEILSGVQTPGVPRLYRIGNTTLFVTCGTGYSFIPVRFGAPPEVALITLRRTGAAQAEAPVGTTAIDSLLKRYGATDSVGGAGQ